MLCVVVVVVLAFAQEPWSGRLPNNVVFVKGKKVAGTTVGGIVRRLGRKLGIAFFSPVVPSLTSNAWRSGGREKWILERFGEFVKASDAPYVAWAQEQTLRPRRSGVEAASLMAVATKAWRVTIVREPYAHALSACTHFGPCAAKTVGNKQFRNTSSAARVAWVDGALGPAQMTRFVTPDPVMNATATVDFYHAVLLADDLDRSLVALALAIDGVGLDDVLHIAAKTTHTARRPPVEPQPPDFLDHLKTLFYAGHDPNEQHAYENSPHLAPDTRLYLRAKARLRATVDAVGPDRFDRELRRYRRMQARMLLACSTRHHASQNATDRRSLPAGISPRAARQCLYADQGCGYRCIDAWLAERDSRLRTRVATRHHRASRPRPNDDVDDPRPPLSPQAQAPRPRGEVIIDRPPPRAT